MIRIDGATPSGGAYSEMVMFDKDGNAVDDKNKAVTCVIRECAENGDLIAETFGYCTGTGEQYHG